jgi:hypothetical protein
LVEQSIRNRQVIGSSPIVGSIILSLRSTPPLFLDLAYLSKAPDAAGSERESALHFVVTAPFAAKQAAALPSCSGL